MSYAANVLRRRQEMERAFRERYNPMEDVVSALSDIDKEAFRRQQLTAEEERAKAEEKRSIERFGLEKIKTEKETARLDRQEQEARDDRVALAEERRARGAKEAAREAAVRQKTKQEEEQRAAEIAAEQVFGKMQREGLTSKDIFRTKTMSDDLAGVVAAHGGDTPAMKVGTTMNDIEDIADASGVPADVLMSMVQKIESDRAQMGADLGLLEAKTQKEKEAADALRRKGRGTGKTTTPEEAARKGRMASFEERKAAADAARSEEKLVRDRMAAGSNGIFQLTESQRNKLQDRRTAVLDRATAAKGIRDLLAKYPDMDKYIGTIDQYISSVRAKSGDGAAAEILSALGRASDEYRTAVTGAAASDQERAMLADRVPNAGDTVASILGKLAVDDEYFKNKFAIIDAQFQANDIRGADALLGITGVAPIAPAAAAPAAPKKALPASVQSEIEKYGLED
jgi:hypothetical protein